MRQLCKLTGLHWGIITAHKSDATFLSCNAFTKDVCLHSYEQGSQQSNKFLLKLSCSANILNALL